MTPRSQTVGKPLVLQLSFSLLYVITLFSSRKKLKSKYSHVLRVWCLAEDHQGEVPGVGAAVAQYCPVEAGCKPYGQLEFSGGHVKISDKKLRTLTMVLFIQIYPNHYFSDL